MKALVVALILAPLAAPITAPAVAQTGQLDRPAYRRLADGMASVVYLVAWPTATYKRIELNDVDVTSDGAIVTFRLHGASAFADGDLWVDVRLHMRSSGEVTRLEWGDYNGLRTASSASTRVWATSA
jgi:hypothetical protein